MAFLDSEPPLLFDSEVHFDDEAVPSTPKPMDKILRHWLKLGRAARVAFFRTVADNLAKTPPPLANPNPPLAQYEAAVALAEAKLQVVGDLEQALKAARLEVGPAVDAASEATELMARRSEDATGGNAAQMVAIGFVLVGSVDPIGPMTRPADFNLTMGDNDGELDWHCHPVLGASTYEARTTPNPNDPASWKMHTAVTRSSGTLTGLPSGVRQYVEVRALGPLGPGPWSDVASKMVP